MAYSLQKTDKRTAYCAEFSAKNVGEYVTLYGWAQKTRDLGALVFIDLRDRSGIIQLAFDEDTDPELFKKAQKVRAEYTLMAKGKIRHRGGAVNKNIPTGEIEVAVDVLEVFAASETPPFEITEQSNVKMETRLKYRFLDLRRPDLQKNIMARHEIIAAAREYFYSQGFLEIETPCLIKSTPEGARDYLVPSRIHHGCFYALPQSPQLYKQLLMIAGFDRYFQVARCFRDEDLRADRQPEFTQLDLEMSFVRADDVMEVTEGFLKYVFKKVLDRDLQLPLRRMTWAEAMRRYGSDKPDLRFGLELCDLTDAAKGCSFKVFSGAVANGGSVRGLRIPGGASEFSRKEIDKLTETLRSYGAKGLAYYKDGEEISSSYAKFLTEDENKAILSAAGVEKGDILFIVADKDKVVFDSLGALRNICGRKLGLIKKDDFQLLWVTEFPMYEYDETEGRYYAMHHPFTSPMDEDVPLFDTDPGKMRAKAYDIVINGTEAGGGSIRIHDPDVQNKSFEILGITPEDAKVKFDFLLEGLKYGAPPHGGLAFGADRLVMLLAGIEDIRDVIAFPKVQNASELMSGAPGPADPKSLEELAIAVTDVEENK